MIFAPRLGLDRGHDWPLATSTALASAELAMSMAVMTLDQSILADQSSMDYHHRTGREESTVHSAFYICYSLSSYGSNLQL